MALRLPGRAPADGRDTAVRRVDAKRPPGVAAGAELRPAAHRTGELARRCCPWCGEAHLVGHLGRRDDTSPVVVDRCLACGHLVRRRHLGREPRPHDGADPDARLVASLQRGDPAANRRRAAEVVQRLRPVRWLVVGTDGDAYRRAARALVPDAAVATVSGLVDDATPLSPQVCEAFDVVSMHHHLGFADDPRAELEAAVRALAPGGVVVVEQFDPLCRWARCLGPWWLPWSHPGHHHVMPATNICRAVEVLGCEVLAVQGATAQPPVDLRVAVGRRLRHAASSPLAQEGTGVLAPALCRALLRGAHLPAMAAATVVDRAAQRCPDAPGGSSSYQVIARRRTG